MDKQRKAQVVFHLTGRHPPGAAPDAMLAGLRPALLAGYRRLEELRYDFPLVLVRDGGESVLSLTAVVISRCARRRRPASRAKRCASAH